MPKAMPTEIIALSGAEPETFVSGVDDTDAMVGTAFDDSYDISRVCEAETDLRLLKSEISGHMETLADRYGAMDPRVQALADMVDYVSDQIEASGDETRIDANNAEFEVGGYSTSAILGVMMDEAAAVEISGPTRATGLFQPLHAKRMMDARRKARKRRLDPAKRAALRACMMQCRNASGHQWKGWNAKRAQQFAQKFAKRNAIGDVEAVEVEAQNIAATHNVADLRRLARAMRRRRVGRMCACRGKRINAQALRSQMKTDAAVMPTPALKNHATAVADALDVEAVVSGTFDQITDPDEIAELVEITGIDEDEVGDVSGDYEITEEVGIAGKKKKKKKRKKKVGFFKRLGRGLKKAGRKIKKGLKKFGRGVAKVAKKIGKGIVKAALFIPRLIAKGVLELFDKGGGGAALIYTYLTDAQAKALGPKVVAKRKKQMGIRRFIIKGIGWKEKRFNKMVRNGIRRKFKKSPEQWIKELMKRAKHSTPNQAPRGGKVRGIGEEFELEPVTAGIGFIPAIAAAIPVLIKIIKKIASFFKKKPPAGKDAMPDESDFELVPADKLEEVEQSVDTGADDGNFDYGGGGGAPAYDTDGGISPTGGGDSGGGGSYDDYGGGGTQRQTSDYGGGSEDMPIAPNPTAGGGESGGGMSKMILPLALAAGAALMFMKK